MHKSFSVHDRWYNEKPVLDRYLGSGIQHVIRIEDVFIAAMNAIPFFSRLD
jgi:hypothetical protein